jgi:SAM-dependent methyltransferase
MRYDPVKDRLAALARDRPFVRRILYAGLDLVFLRNWHVRRALRRLIGNVPRVEGRQVHVLDAGSGFGQYAYRLARMRDDVHVTAVDVKTDYLRDTREFFKAVGLSGRAEFFEEDLTRLSLDGPFDLILSVDVMEHIEDDRAVFRHFHRVLSAGGHVIVNTPSDLGGSAVRAAGDESFIEEHVRDGYSAQELRDKLGGAGLDVVDSRYTYGRWGTVAWHLLVKVPLQMLSLSRLMALLLPLYYALALPVGIFLNAMDVATENREGTGLLVVARRRA